MNKWLTTIAVLLCSVTLSAHDFEVNGIFYNIIPYTDNEVEVTFKGDYESEYSNRVEIPSRVSYNGNTYNVTRIGASAFSDCSELFVVIIPESVTSIGSFAFRSSWGISSITLPENLTSIGENAFFGTGIRSIIIPTSMTYIGCYAFSGCYYLTTVTIPEGVKGIEEGAFDDCTSLTAITLPTSVTSIGWGAFRNCSSLATINIPEGVTSIGDYAFNGCSSLTTITIPASVMSIGYDAFDNTNLPIENNIRYADTWASEVTDNTKDKYTLRDNTTGIADYTFADCTNLTFISIPSSVTTIGRHAFYGCSGLTAITLPEGVTTIGNAAFASCSSLTAITCEAPVPPTVGPLAFHMIDKSIPVYVPISSVSAYQSAVYWNEFSNIQAISETININQYGSGTYCSEYALDFSKVEGLKAYAATGYKTSTGVITLTRVMTSQPGMGLFLKGEPGDYSVPILESTDENSLNMLVGILEKTTVNNKSDDDLYINYKYTIKPGDAAPLFYQLEDGSSLDANKAYLQIPKAWVPNSVERAISLRFDDGEGTTDMKEEVTDSEDSEAIYDLMGRKVREPQKGCVYIVKGKKVMN